LQNKFSQAIVSSVAPHQAITQDVISTAAVVLPIVCRALCAHQRLLLLNPLRHLSLQHLLRLPHLRLNPHLLRHLPPPINQ
jgi:hypothetical protein